MIYNLHKKIYIGITAFLLLSIFNISHSQDFALRGTDMQITLSPEFPSANETITAKIEFSNSEHIAIIEHTIKNGI